MKHAPMLSEKEKNHFDEQFRQHWNSFSQFIQLDEVASQNIFEVLYRAYSEPQRAYHTTQHIVECLDLLEEIRHKVTDPRAIELAIWFHDIVYEPKSDRNQQNSADVMTQLMSEHIDQITIKTVYDWIIATQTHQASSDEDLNYLLDIDLSILGSAENRFQQYQQQIQFEYRWVDSVIYRSKRTEVLKHFLSMQPIFQTTHFREKFERQARLNLNDAIYA